MLRYMEIVWENRQKDIQKKDIGPEFHLIFTVLPDDKNCGSEPGWLDFPKTKNYFPNFQMLPTTSTV